jgi:hypothetical protein
MKSSIIKKPLFFFCPVQFSGVPVQNFMVRCMY